MDPGLGFLGKLGRRLHSNRGMPSNGKQKLEGRSPAKFCIFSRGTLAAENARRIQSGAVKASDWLVNRFGICFQKEVGLCDSRPITENGREKGCWIGLEGAQGAPGTRTLSPNEERERAKARMAGALQNFFKGICSLIGVDEIPRG